MLSQYRTISLISQSKNSVVSVVEEISSAKRFVLKQILNIRPNKKSYKEINIVSSLEHPNIAKPAYFSLSEETPYILYDLLEGTTLADFIIHNPKIKIEDAFNIILQLLDALSYIHIRGIIHCDINPHNIFITKENKVKLLDFCSAMTLDDAANIRDGVIVGTFPYLSPEQTGLTKFKIDNRSDLYCVAIIFYQMLAGTLPFSMKSESIKELLDASIKRKIEPIKFLPKILNEILLKGLKPAPEERYQTAEGMVYDIEKVKEDILKCENSNLIIGIKDNYFSVLRRKNFVVREKEISILHSLLEKLSNGKSASALIYGRSGIGKSFLTDWFIKSIDRSSYTSAIAKGNRFSITQPFAIIRQLIIDYFNKLSELSSEEIEKFRSNLQIGSESYSGVVCNIVPEIRHWFDKVGEVDLIEREKETDRILYVMSSFLTKVSTLRKTIFIIDDFQWCDRFSLLIILRLIEEKIPIFIIGCYRITINNPALICFDKDLTKVNFDKIINLREFSRDDVLQFIRSKFFTIEKDDYLADVLYRRTEGIPYTVEEALRYLILQGKITFENGKWRFDINEIDGLPEKIDAISIILDKYEKLEENEKKFLKISSLIEGVFDPRLIQKILSIDETCFVSILTNLTVSNFIYPSYLDKYTFVHDRVQEAIANTIDNREKASIYEKIGKFYAEEVKDNKEMVFQTAEIFCKTEDINAAILWCYKAALYAIEKNSYFDSIRYLRNIIILSDKIEKSNLEKIVSITEVKMLLAKSLMITGANEQALGIFAELRTESSLKENQNLEIQYYIGEIYKNIGEYEKSSIFFLQALSSHKIKIPKKRVILFLSLLIAMFKQFIFSSVLGTLLPKKKNDKKRIIIKILNELSYSLYFQDMLKSFYVHYLALNYSESLVDCPEKADTYLLHVVPLYQLFFRKKAIKYFYKALNIARKLKRKDTEALALSFGGMLHFFNAEWKRSEQLLTESNELFKNIGDVNNRFINIEHIRKIYFLIGDIQNAYKITENLIEISKKRNSNLYLYWFLVIKNFFDFLLKNSLDEKKYFQTVEYLSKIDSPLLYIDFGSYVSYIEIEKGKYTVAYQRIKSLLPLLFQRCINSEYQVKFFSIFCTLLYRELIGRKRRERKIEVSFLKLKLEFLYSLIIFCLSTICYPAYRGAFYRALAWFLALNRLKRFAATFFKKAIKYHHKLDMKYEEAISLRDYAMFLDEFHSLHGEARDYYEKAYKLFKNCGVKFETDRLEPIVGSSTLTKKTYVELKDTTVEKIPSSSSTSDLNVIQFDTLLEVSKNITEIEDLHLLLKQILMAMITATGAQYGYMFINRNVYENFEPFAMSFEGKEVPVEEVPIFKDLINKVNEIHSLQYGGEVIEDESEIETSYIRSDMCIPLNWRDKYLGYVYLVNDHVRGLFGEYAQKAAMILATHAGILLENAYLIDKQRRFNEELQQKVKEQTEDIRQKNLQLEEANLKLVESERMKGILSGTIVHDINNYASGIDGIISNIIRRAGDDPKLKRLLNVAKDACSDIMNLTSNLLDIAKMDEGRLVIKEELIDYSFIVQLVNKFEASALFEEKEITTRIIPPLNEFIISADVYLFQRLLQNLYNNAAKYAPKGSYVELSFYNGEKENIICLFNSGPPIPDSEKEAIFEKYARIDKKTSQYSKGLGLFFCKMVMNAHGGRIWLETDEKGNYFKMAFPIKKEKIEEHNITATSIKENSASFQLT